MPEFVDREGNLIEVAPNQVQDALAAGLEPTADSVIGVVSPSGRAGTIPGAKLREALQKGFRLETASDETERLLENEFGDRPIAAGLLGAARGLSMGLSDFVVEPFVGDEALREIRERNRTASLAGEIVGSVAPALVSGGSSQVAQFLRATPAGRAFALGERAREAVQAGGTVSATTRALAGGAAAATEGILFGAGETLTEVTLAKDPVTVDYVLSRLASNTLLGAGLGGGLGAGASLLGNAARVGADKLRQFADRPAAPGPVGEDLLRTIAKSPRRSTELLGVAKREAKGLRTTLEAEEAATAGARAAAQEAVDVASKEVQEALGRFRSDFDKVQNLSRQRLAQARKASGLTPEAQAAVQALEEAREEVRRLFPFEEVRVKKKGPKELRFGISDEDIVRTIQENPAALEAIERQRLSARDAHMALNPRSKVQDMDELFQAPASVLVEPAQKLAQAERRLAELAQTADSPRLVEIKNRLEELERTISLGRPEFAARAARETVELAETAGLKIDDVDLLRLARDGGLPLEKLPPEGSDLHTMLKAQAYRQAAKAQLAARRGPRIPGGDSLDLLGAIAGDYMLDGAFGMVLGGVAGKILGRLAEPLLARGMGGLKAQVASAALETARRASDAVDAFLKSGTGDRARRVATTSAVKAMQSVSYDGEKPKQGQSPAQAAKARAKELHALLADPARLRRVIEEGLAPMRRADFKLADVLIGRVHDKIAFLASKAPKDPRLGVAGAEDRWRPSDAEVEKFARYIRAAEDPLSILEDMRKGKLTLEAVETVQTLYPALFADVQRQILADLPRLQTLPYGRQVQLSILFGVPVDSTMRPEFVVGLQQRFRQEETEPGPEPGRGPAPPSRAIARLKPPAPTQAQQQAGGEA